MSEHSVTKKHHIEKVFLAKSLLKFVASPISLSSVLRKFTKLGKHPLPMLRI